MIKIVSVVSLANTGGIVGVRLVELKSHVSNEREMQIIQQLGACTGSSRYYRCLEVCKSTEVKMTDFMHKNAGNLALRWGIDCSMPAGCGIVQGVEITECSDGYVFLDKLKYWNLNVIFKPHTCLQEGNVNLVWDVMPKTQKFLYVNGVPYCKWSPCSQKVSSPSDISFQLCGDVLLYKYQSPIYILLPSSIRHKLVFVGEELTLNLQNGVCMKTVAGVKGDYYVKSAFRFNRETVSWEEYGRSERVRIDGFKRKQ